MRRGPCWGGSQVEERVSQARRDISWSRWRRGGHERPGGRPGHTEVRAKCPEVPTGFGVNEAQAVSQTLAPVYTSGQVTIGFKCVSRRGWAVGCALPRVRWTGGRRSSFISTGQASSAHQGGVGPRNVTGHFICFPTHFNQSNLSAECTCPRPSRGKEAGVAQLPTTSLQDCPGDLFSDTPGPGGRI